MAKIQKIVATLILLLFTIPASFAAEEFAVSTADGSKAICIGATDVLVDSITGSAGKYRVEASGKAAIFSTTVPTEFILDQGQKQNIYSYITIPSTASEGLYDLVVKVSGPNNSTKVQTHMVTVKNCHGTSLISDGDKRICPCEQAKYRLVLENSGEFREKFNIQVSGTAKEWANLSKSIIDLDPGKSSEFYITIAPPCQIYGTYSLDIKATAEQSLARASTKIKLEIMPCYEYDLSANKEYNICENEVIEIPILVKNRGTADNNFAFIMDKAPGWASIKAKSLYLKSNSEESIMIKANPPFGTEGVFPITVEAMSSGGAVKKTLETSIRVRKCYDAYIKSGTPYDRFCGSKKEYTATITNKGEFKSTYNLAIDGPSWLELSKDSAEIEAGKNLTIKISAQPPAKLRGKYAAKITATDLASNRSYSDRFDIEIFPPEECYKASLITEKDRIGVELEKAATLFIILRNDGISSATYIVDISGSGGKFSMINPKIATIAPNKSETLFLYVSPPLFTKSGSYIVNVTARVKDTNIIASKDISINVLEKGEPFNESTELKEVRKSNLLSDMIIGIKNFFKRMFMVQPTNKTAEILANISETNDTIDKSITKIFGKPNESKENSETSIGNKTAEKAARETIESANNNASKSESKITGKASEEAENSYAEYIENAALQEKASNLKANAQKLDDFMAKYKYYLIAAAAISLVAIIIITGVWRKIVEFFEEEVPENKKK